MSAKVGDIVVPGEEFANAKELTIDNKKIVLGDGVRFAKVKLKSLCLRLHLKIIDATSFQSRKRVKFRL